MDRKNRRNNLAHIRMLIIWICVAAIDSLAACRSKRITLVPENDGVYNRPGYMALSIPEAGRCGELYFVADTYGRRQRKYMRSG